LWQILQDFQERSALTQVLIDEWFAGASNIEGILQVNAFAELQEELERAGGKIYQREELDQINNGLSLPVSLDFKANLSAVIRYLARYIRKNRSPSKREIFCNPSVRAALDRDWQATRKNHLFLYFIMSGRV
jgi:hypothetical protein